MKRFPPDSIHAVRRSSSLMNHPLNLNVGDAWRISTPSHASVSDFGYGVPFQNESGSTFR